MSKDFVLPDTFNPELLVWARLNEGMSVEEAAKALDVTMLKLQMLEDGTQRPLWSFIERCAKIYRRPSAVFLLYKTPKHDRKIVTGVKLMYHDGTEQEYKFEEE